MDPQSAITALQTLAILAGFLFVWNVLWPRHVSDALRQNLFSIRHRLFVAAAQGTGGLTFQNPAYQTLRTSINALINVADSLSVWELIFLAFNDLCRGTLNQKTAVEVSGEAVTSEQKAALEPMDRAMRTEIAKHLFWKTPVASSAAVVCCACGFVIYLFSRYVGSVCNARRIFDFHSATPVRTRVEQSVAKEIRVVVQRVTEYDRVAPWSRDVENSERQLAYSGR